LIQIKARFAGFEKNLPAHLTRGERRSVSYKDLLLVLDAEANARERIDFACTPPSDFLRISSACTHCRRRKPRHFGYYDLTLLDPFFVELRERARSAAVKMREAFDHAAAIRGPSAERRQIPEGPDADPALHARYADWPSSASSIPNGRKRI
jgi:hypothetical protein